MYGRTPREKGSGIPERDRKALLRGMGPRRKNRYAYVKGLKEALAALDEPKRRRSAFMDDEDFLRVDDPAEQAWEKITMGIMLGPDEEEIFRQHVDRERIAREQAAREWEAIKQAIRERKARETGGKETSLREDEQNEPR